jgi:hypothetical protein
MVPYWYCNDLKYRISCVEQISSVAVRFNQITSSRRPNLTLNTPTDVFGTRNNAAAYGWHSLLLC